ncbi:MAG: hypothetical protein ACK4E0_07025 [Chitinophagaceae bacterium]
MFTTEERLMQNSTLDKQSLDKLFHILRQTLNPDLSDPELYAYFSLDRSDYFCVNFIHRGEDLAGFSTVGAYPRKVNGKKVVILRSAFGLKDEYKDGKFPLQSMFYKYMKYKLRNLFTPVYVAGFMANPLMYAMICKYTLTCYPRRNQKTSASMLRFADDLMASMNLLRKKVRPFVVRIHFQVKFKEQDIKRFMSSNDPDVNYFLSINPGFQDRMGVMVLVPVTLPNIIYTFIRYQLRRFRKTRRSTQESSSGKSG